MPGRTRKTAAPAANAPASPAPAPAGTAAPTTPALTFEDAPVPTRTRASVVVNPVMDVCRTIKESMPEGAERSTIARKVTVANEKQVAQVKRWLTDASKSLGCTFRSVPEYNEETKQFVVTFWAVKKIQHAGRRGNGNGTATATQ